MEEDKIGRYEVDVNFITPQNGYNELSGNYTSVVKPEMFGNRLILKDSSYRDNQTMERKSLNQIVINMDQIQLYQVTEISVKEVEQENKLKEEYLRERRELEKEAEIKEKEAYIQYQKSLESFNERIDGLRTMSIKKFLQWKKESK